MAANSRKDVINDAVDLWIAENGFDTTPEVRLAVLMGIQESWKEIEVEEDETVEKAMYGIAVAGEIFKLRIELMRKNLTI